MAKPGRPLARPDYWTKEYVLGKLKSGIPIRKICFDAAEEEGRPRSLCFKKDIEIWRMQDPEFLREYNEILDNRQNQIGTGRNRFHNSISRVLTPDKIDQLFREMELCGGNYYIACEKVGVKNASVLSKINPKSNEFDPVFAARFHNLEAERYADAREKFFDIAMHGGDYGEGNSCALHKILSAGFTTAHMHRDTGVMEVGGTVVHQHGLTPELQEAMAQKVSTVFRNRELKSADIITIDVPVQREIVDVRQ